MSLRFFICVFLFLVWTSANANVHHKLDVSVDPSTSTIKVEDALKLNPKLIAKGAPLEFALHKNLTIENLENIEKIEDGAPAPHLSLYRITDIPNDGEIVLTYSGNIDHSLRRPEEESARSFGSTLGTISDNGVFLDGNSAWYPIINQQLVSFDLTVASPAPWVVVSAGENKTNSQLAEKNHIRWVEQSPQDDIYLIAAPFIRYEKRSGDINLEVYLRKSEPDLAKNYLDIGAQYLAMYEKLLGTYPYKKFAVIENFWETGFGMPSFTLLGPRVMRFPFILHSSYPHEILHNWLGNSVYVDYSKGNWAEGLTAYLADHLVSEQRGDSANYRRNTLQKYTDYVSAKRDIPIAEFRSRHDSASEAVGYGKTLMLFHMLRNQFGDDIFKQALRDLYQRHRFRITSFDDIVKVFNDTTKNDMSGFFSQWVERTGAPSIELSKVEVVTLESGKQQLHLEIEQTQEEPSYTLLVPIVIEYSNSRKQRIRMSVSKRSQSLALDIIGKVVRVAVDPEFDVFRRLDPREIPAAMSQAFGSEKAVAVMPSKASKEQLNGYEQLIDMWRQTQNIEITTVLDSELEQLPNNQTTWILGWSNKYRANVDNQISAYGGRVSGDSVFFDDKEYKRTEHSVVIATRHPNNINQSLIWISNENAASPIGLARKLPHYGKYSYLAFTGNNYENIAKGQWPVVDSPLVKSLTDKALPPLKLAERPALATLDPIFSTQRLTTDVNFLASENLKGRGLASPELDLAADYIAEQFKEAGLEAIGGDYFQSWKTDIKDLGSDIELKNVIGFIHGTDHHHDDESVVIAAHYDHLGLGWPDVRKGNEGKIHFGADDNASGVAVLLELARVLSKTLKPKRNVVFVALTAEEAGLLGSSHYIESDLPFPAEKAIAIINLDAVGRLEDKPLTVFGAGSASEWQQIFRDATAVTGVEIDTNTRPFGASDHINFHEIGVPGVQLFSGIHLDYHRPSDTADKIDSEGMVKVAEVVREAVAYLAERHDALSSQLGEIKLPDGSQLSSSHEHEHEHEHEHNSQHQQKHKQRQHGRKVSIGTVPDFQFAGNGARINDIVPDSPAEKAGLQADDIIIAIDSHEISSLRDYAHVLRETHAGDTLSIRVLRGDDELDISVTAEER